MTKKKFETKEDWEKFRNKILELIMIYNQVKEFSECIEKNIEQVEIIKNYFGLARENAICAFYIKLGAIMTNGKPSLKTFLAHADYEFINKMYKNGLKDIRDKVYAHNVSTFKRESIANEKVDDLISTIIKKAKEVDEKFNEEDISIYYDEIFGNDGIKSILPFIHHSKELQKIKDQLIDLNFYGMVKLDFQSGNIVFETKD